MNEYTQQDFLFQAFVLTYPYLVELDKTHEKECTDIFAGATMVFKDKPDVYLKAVLEAALFTLYVRRDQRDED